MTSSSIALEQKIAQLEAALQSTRSHLDSLQSSQVCRTHLQHLDSLILEKPELGNQHLLLLLSDSALPLGSFAFSSGLESYLAHHPLKSSFQHFLALSISSVASTTLPYVFATYRNPSLLEDLDNDLDASTPCTVARRASLAQGRALLNVWERSFKASGYLKASKYSLIDEGRILAARAEEAITNFAQAMKQKILRTPSKFQANGHYPCLWAVVCCSKGISLRETGYVLLLSHAKAVISAAVRASVLGPYAAQGLLASDWLRGNLAESLSENWDRNAGEAGQCAPILDLWVGRHELLYSRIFNS